MKGRNYRSGNSMAYTRKEYIKGSPQQKITKFVMGDSGGSFPYKVMLISLDKIQVRHNALEAARVATNKLLEDKLGDKGYLLRIRVYPHFVLRENKMLAFAGADRIQEGMSRSFGKPVGLAARIEPGQPVMEVGVNKEGIDLAKEALRLGVGKLPITYIIRVSEN